jgi:ElaB/YqjD/DUF883 family membrane-anchored ribosome-binding protein
MSDQTQTQAGPTNGLHDESRTDQAQQKAQEAAGQAKEQAQQAAGKAQERARQMVDERSTQVGQQVSSQAGDLRSVGEQLRSQGKDQPAKVAEQAAERVERLGGYLERSDADTILSDAEDLARKNPWAVVAGGLVLGFAASRFLKASSSERYSARQTGGELPRSTGERYGVGTQPGGPPASPATPAAPAAGLGETPIAPTGAHV